MQQRRTIILLCILALCAPAFTRAQSPTLPPAGAIDRAITVVLVEPPGETFTPDRQADAMARLRRAMAWWSDLSPIPTVLHIDAVYFTRVTSDTQTVEDSAPAIPPSNIIVVIIDNDHTHHTLGGAQGMTILFPGESERVYLTTTATDAIYAHELGHAVYHLPDFYAISGACVGIDIMCLTSAQAYTGRFLGCPTLAYLGASCRRLYLPIVQ